MLSIHILRVRLLLSTGHYKKQIPVGSRLQHPAWTLRHPTESCGDIPCPAPLITVGFHKRPCREGRAGTDSDSAVGYDSGQVHSVLI